MCTLCTLHSNFFKIKRCTPSTADRDGRDEPYLTGDKSIHFIVKVIEIGSFAESALKGKSTLKNGNLMLDLTPSIHFFILLTQRSHNFAFESVYQFAQEMWMALILKQTSLTSGKHPFRACRKSWKRNNIFPIINKKIIFNCFSLEIAKFVIYINNKIFQPPRALTNIDDYSNLSIDCFQTNLPSG